jgi:hypothetical protein
MWGPPGTPTNAIFVDNYNSYFSQSYGNIDVHNPQPGIVNNSLSKITDVNLNPNVVWPEFNSVGGGFALFLTAALAVTPGGLTLAAVVGGATAAEYIKALKAMEAKHQYALNWYAGSANTVGTNNPVGLAWSPLIAGASTPPTDVQDQAWPPANGNNQFTLRKATTTTVTPTFQSVTLTKGHGPFDGGVTQTGPDNAITALTLGYERSMKYTTSEFSGQFDKKPGMIGFSFSYSFAGSSSPGATLQIYVNNRTYFSVNSGVAQSGTVPGTGTFTATFGLVGQTHPLYRFDPLHVYTPKETGSRPEIVIRLHNSAPTQAGAQTQVTVSNFQEFKLAPPQA